VMHLASPSRDLLAAPSPPWATRDRRPAGLRWNEGSSCCHSENRTVLLLLLLLLLPVLL